MKHLILFPDGRKVNISNLVSFIYGLNEIESRIFDLLTELDKKLSAEEISKELGLTETSVTLSLNNLIDKGLIAKEETFFSEGREITSKSVYFIDSDRLSNKITLDLESIRDLFLSLASPTETTKRITIDNKSLKMFKN